MSFDPHRAGTPNDILARAFDRLRAGDAIGREVVAVTVVWVRRVVDGEPDSAVFVSGGTLAALVDRGLGMVEALAVTAHLAAVCNAADRFPSTLAWGRKS